MGFDFMQFLEALIVILLIIACGWLLIKNQRYRQTIEKLTTLDPISGLKNREAVLDQLNVSYLGAKRYRQSMTLALLRLIDFKGLSEDDGIKTAEHCIKNVANLLETELRTTDLLGRISDDTFLIVLTHTHSHNSRPVFERLVTTLNNQILDEFSMTCAMGCSNLHDETPNVAILTKEAEFAMKRAVNQGNKVQYFRSEPNEVNS